MEIVWPSAGATARKRSAQDKSPCQSCRSRKKRCYHDEKADKASVAHEPESEITTRDSSPDPGRIAEYDPESVLAELSKSAHEGSPALEPSPRSHARGRPPPRATQAVDHDALITQRAQRRLMWYKRHKRADAPSLSENHRRYLAEEGAFFELPRATTDALLPMYISLLDDLVPVVDGADVFRAYSNGQSSIFLVRAICLVVCKAKQAAPFLRLEKDGPILEPLDFAKSLLTGLDTAIKADLEPDRVVKVQILALMHLHNDGPSGMDRSSAYLAQAVSEAWAMCLHWQIPGNPDQEQCDTLWWTLRNLDRLNKPIMGAAPFLIDDGDIGVSRVMQSRGYRSQVLQIALGLGDLMSAATRIYKASSTLIEDDTQDFPLLEALTSNTPFDRFHQSHRSYLEIWYHVAAVLSCRYSGPGTPIYNRRLTSADRILAIMSSGYESLPPLPLIPYAMSMSTTVFYRAYRDDERDLEPTQRDLRSCCEVLEGLSKTWTSVKAVSKMAKKLWKYTKMGAMSQGKSSGAALGNIPRTVFKANGTTMVAGYRVGEGSVTSPVPTPPMSVGHAMPLPLQSGEGVQGMAAQVAGPYSDRNVPGMQLDWDFHDMFDYGMPNVFRDPVSWEYLQLANDEERSAGAFTSPEAGFGSC